MQCTLGTVDDSFHYSDHISQRITLRIRQRKLARQPILPTIALKFDKPIVLGPSMSSGYPIAVAQSLAQFRCLCTSSRVAASL